MRMFAVAGFGVITIDSIDRLEKGKKSEAAG